MGRKGSDRIMEGRFYVAVVQAVILFGYKMWVLTPQLEKSLEGFCHRAAQRMTGMVPKRQQDGTWVYPPIQVGLAMVGLEEIGVYTARHQNMVVQYIAPFPSIDLWLVVEWKPGMHLYRRWWEQPTLDILGIRVGHASEEGKGRDWEGIVRGRGRVGSGRMKGR